MKLRIDCRATTGTLPPFWASTGFTPANLLLRPDMQQTLQYVGALGPRGVRHVRIHYLLNLVKASGLETPTPRYDWSDLDRGIDTLLHNGLQPFFEVMGNPSDWFTDFNHNGQLHAWRRLVRDLALHLMDRYGRETVEAWWFETWNEPDIGWWHQWPQDIASFLNYYDACSEGLREANPKLKFGGPGGARHMSELSLALFAHCDSGRNYFTGERGVRIDFISAHEKGAPSSREEYPPDTAGMVRREQVLLEHIRKNHPRLAGLPLTNNEADPIVGWMDIHSWHAMPYYAAWMARSLNQHLAEFLDKGVPYLLLGNDHGFLGSWGMRTQLAEFGTEEQLARGEFELIKKPGLNVMALFALLGEERLVCTGCGDAMIEAVGAIATRTAHGEIIVLLYNGVDDLWTSGSDRVQLELEGLPFERGTITHYRIDRTHSNPFDHWASNRLGKRPSPDALAALRDRHEIDCLAQPGAVAIRNGGLPLAFDLPLPSVSLVRITPAGVPAPSVPAVLRATPYRGLGDRENLLLTWSPTTTPFRTYEVLFSEDGKEPFTRLNRQDLLTPAFLHARRTARGTGHYRIRVTGFDDAAAEGPATAF